jgi:hypothetical protein
MRGKLVKKLITAFLSGRFSARDLSSRSSRMMYGDTRVGKITHISPWLYFEEDVGAAPQVSLNGVKWLLYIDDANLQPYTVVE